MRRTPGVEGKWARSVVVTGIIVASIVVILLQIRWMRRQKPRFQDTSHAQFTRIIDRQTLRVFCEHCEGSGIVRDPANEEHLAACPVCFGMGVHRIRFLEDDDVLCPSCRGLGRMPGTGFDEAAFCERCDGSGLLQVNWDKLKIPVQKVICDHCDGRGVLRNPENPVQLDRCPICFGLGSRLVRRLDANDEYCPACGGMGRLFDTETGAARWCLNCGGRGLIVSPARPVTAELEAPPNP